MTDSAQPTGATASRYEVLFELASGGMGRIAIARVRGTAGFQRLVALKTIHPFYATEPRFQEMFFEEARLAAGIHHPNVVPVLDLGELEDTYFLTMEYVPGESLGNLMIACHEAKEQIPFGVSLRWIADACAGLHAAHELRDAKDRLLGLVHRDVSPSNLIVTDHGSVKLIDFGIAKALSTRKETTSGALKGKVGYLSPEQVLAKKLDRRSDIFSLGVILYEVTTLRKLFGNPSHVETLQDIVRGEIPDPRDLVRDYPDAVAGVVMKALERDRDKRYQTAEEMGAAVERAAQTIANPMVAADVTAWTRKRFGGLFDLRRKKIAVAMEAADRAEQAKKRAAKVASIAKRVPLAQGDDEFQERTETAQIVAPMADVDDSRESESWDGDSRSENTQADADPFEMATVVQNKPSGPPTLTSVGPAPVTMTGQTQLPPAQSTARMMNPMPSAVETRPGIPAVKHVPPAVESVSPMVPASSGDTKPGVPVPLATMPVGPSNTEVSLASITVDRAQVLGRLRAMPRWMPIALVAGVVCVIGAVFLSRGGSTEHASSAPTAVTGATAPTVVPTADPGPVAPIAQHPQFAPQPQQTVPSQIQPAQTQQPVQPAPPAVDPGPGEVAPDTSLRNGITDRIPAWHPAPSGSSHSSSSSHRNTSSHSTSGTVPGSNHSNHRRAPNDFRPDDP